MRFEFIHFSKPVFEFRFQFFEIIRSLWRTHLVVWLPINLSIILSMLRISLRWSSAFVLWSSFFILMLTIFFHLLAALIQLIFPFIQSLFHLLQPLLALDDAIRILTRLAGR